MSAFKVLLEHQMGENIYEFFHHGVKHRVRQDQPHKIIL